MIIAPALNEAQEASWHALFEVAKLVPDHWCVVGGQMVHLICWELGIAPRRATVDVDAGLDVRGEPQILLQFTEALRIIGFEVAGTSAQGYQHRWLRGLAQIDVLIPVDLGEFADQRRGAGGGTTIASHGTQQALDRSQTVAVRVGGHSGLVRRPNLIGALVCKAAALMNAGDSGKERHIEDFALLASALSAVDLREPCGGETVSI